MYIIKEINKIERLYLTFCEVILAGVEFEVAK